MVLSRKVGKPRPFWRGLLLTVFTAGIYSLYWNYKVHAELYRQFELAQEGRDEGVTWYIVGLVLFPLQFVYFWTMVANVRYVRVRLALPRGLSPGAFLALFVGGVALFFAGALYAVSVLPADPESVPTEELEAAFERALPAFVGGSLAALVLVPLAYYRLQRDINAVWAAYDARIAELAAPPPVTPVEPLATDAPATYWADLRPPGAP